MHHASSNKSSSICHEGPSGPCAPCSTKATKYIVSSPDQIFCTRPADSSKSRAWTLSLQKLGQVYIQRSVNWVIVGVNYIISYWQPLPEQSDWCNNMPIPLYDYAPVLPVNVSRPYFSTRPQGTCKNLVSGDKTTKYTPLVYTTEIEICKQNLRKGMFPRHIFRLTDFWTCFATPPGVQVYYCPNWKPTCLTYTNCG